MKKIKWLACCLAAVMLSGAFTACTSDPADGPSVSVTTGPTAESTGTPIPPDAVPVEVKPNGIKLSDTSYGGDPVSAFADNEDCWKGYAGNLSVHSFSFALESRAVIRSITVKTPGTEEECKTLRGALLEASVDGKEWVKLKEMGTMLVPDKTYRITVQNDTPFGYVRVRQPEDKVSNAFVIRYLKIEGIPTEGAKPDVSNIAVEGQTAFELLTVQKVNVYQTNAGDPMDIFRNGGKIWSGTQNLPRLHTVTATLGKKSVIRQIKMPIPNPTLGTNKMDGSVFEASTDGKTWKTLATVQTPVQAGTTYVYPVKDETAYSYFRITQGSDRLGNGFDVPNILIFGTSTDEVPVPLETEQIAGEFIPVKNIGTTLQSGGDPDLVWAKESDSFWLGAQKQDDRHYIMAELPADVLITRIVYRSTNQFLVRSRGAEIQVSNDKENWTTVVTLPTSPEDPLYPNKNTGYDAAGEYREYYLDPDQPYRYIRVIQAANLVGYFWTVGNVNLYGVPVQETEA